MDQKEIKKEANRLKQEAGKELKRQLELKFSELVKDKIIKSFDKNLNIAHVGYEYKEQYLANFILTTLDDKFIVINSSTSFRQDRVKIKSYDLQGIKDNSNFSQDIIALILLYPDSAITESPNLTTFVKRFNEGILYSPATHVLLLSELLDFLANHKAEVEVLNEIEEELIKKDGSHYGIKGNTFEKQVVQELNNQDLLDNIQKSNSTDSSLYDEIVLTLCQANKILPTDIYSLEASNSILKLHKGGSAKTDVLIKLNTHFGTLTETVSIKTTTKNQVSCHDYKAEDFIRVLGIQDSKLADYFVLFQEQGSYDKFEESLPDDYSIEDFESLLTNFQKTLVEWALKGKHDKLNLIDEQSQISNYLLINKDNKYKFIDYDSYINKLFNEYQNKKYGIPLVWTYPSKHRGERIQFKVPILI